MMKKWLLFAGLLSTSMAQASSEDINSPFYVRIGHVPAYGQQYLTVEYYGSLFDCFRPQALSLVVVFPWGDGELSQTLALNNHCPFDGPGPRSWASIPVFLDNPLAAAYQETRQLGVPFTFELAVVSQGGEWDSHYGENYQVSVFLDESGD